MNDLKEQLIQNYWQILKDEQNLILQMAEEKRLSDILLGFVPNHYQMGQNNILIIGRETRGWRIPEISPIMEYSKENIQKSMEHSQKHFNHKIKQTKRFDFFDLIKRIALRSGENHLLWNNLFCVDYETSHPKYQGELFNEIKRLSQKLLFAQIHLLKPNFIILACGLDPLTQMVRDEYFPHLFWDKTSLGHFPHGYLQRCFLFPENSNYQPIAYRICHPAAINRGKYKKEKKQAIQKLIELLPQK